MAHAMKYISAIAHISQWRYHKRHRSKTALMSYIQKSPILHEACPSSERLNAMHGVKGISYVKMW